MFVFKIETMTYVAQISFDNYAKRKYDHQYIYKIIIKMHIKPYQSFDILRSI